MANHTTGAQRYNNRMDKIWDRAKANGAFNEKKKEVAGKMSKSDYGKEMTELAIKNSTSYKGTDSVIHSPHKIPSSFSELRKETPKEAEHRHKLMNKERMRGKSY